MKEKDDMKVRKEFGRRVKEAREKKGITQFDLSIRCGTDIRQIQRIENEEITTSITMAYFIAKGLEVSMGELFDF